MQSGEDFRKQSLNLGRVVILSFNSYLIPDKDLSDKFLQDNKFCVTVCLFLWDKILIFSTIVKFLHYTLYA